MESERYRVIDEAGPRRERLLVQVFVISVALALAGSFACAAHAIAAPGWGSPTRISDQRNVLGLDYATGPEGFAVATWEVGEFDTEPAPPGGNRPDRLFYAIRDGSEFGEPVSVGRGSNIEVEMAPDAETILSWRRADGDAVVSSFRPGESPGEPEVLLRDSYPPSLAVARGGYAVAAWKPGDAAGVVAAVRPAGGQPFGEPQQLAAKERVGTFGPLARAAGSQAVVAWEGRCGSADSDFSAAFAGADGVFGPAQSVPATSCPYSPFDLEIAADGRAFLLVNGAGPSDGAAIRAAIREPGADFGRARPLGEPRSRAIFGILATGASDSALAIWSTGDRRHRGIGFAQAGPARFGAARSLSTRDSTEYDAATSECGPTLVAWQSLSSYRPVAASIAADGEITRFGRVGPPISRRSLNNPLATVAADGRAAVAWTVRSAGTYKGRGVFVAERRSLPGCER